jgi:hypothetical protein
MVTTSPPQRPLISASRWPKRPKMGHQDLIAGGDQGGQAGLDAGPRRAVDEQGPVVGGAKDPAVEGHDLVHVAGELGVELAQHGGREGAQHPGVDVHRAGAHEQPGFGVEVVEHGGRGVVVGHGVSGVGVGEGRRPGAVKDGGDAGGGVMAGVGVEGHPAAANIGAEDRGRMAGQGLAQALDAGERHQGRGEQDAADGGRDAVPFAGGAGDHGLEVGLDGGGVLLGDHAPVEAQGDPVGNDVGVDAALDQADDHGRGGDAVDAGADAGEGLAVGIQVGQDGGRRLEGVAAGFGLGGVGGPAGYLDLQMQAAVVGGDDGVGEPGRDGEVGLGDAGLEQPFRPDGAADLLVVGEMELDGAGQGRRRGLEGQQGIGVGGEVGLGDGGAAAVHPAVGDLGAVGVPGPAFAGADDVAVGIEGDGGAVAEAPADDQVGGADHARGPALVLGHGVALDGEAEAFEERRRGFGVGGAVAGRVVRRHLDQAGQEGRLVGVVAADEVGDGVGHAQASVAKFSIK